MSQPPLVLEFAGHSRELSRVSQVPFSCASFWQGLRFAVQKHFGRVAASGALLHSALREKGSAGFEPRPSSSSTSFSARRIPRRSRCHLLLMPSSLPPLPRCSCAVLPHRHRAAPTFPSPLPSDAAALDVAVAAAIAQAVGLSPLPLDATAVVAATTPARNMFCLYGVRVISCAHGGREQLELLV